MIKTQMLTKRFDDVVALDSLSTEVADGSVYGLVGSNGAGKSTLLRLMAGVYRPDEGSIEIDGEAVYENEAIKDKIFFVADELFFLTNSKIDDMARFYRGVYSGFDQNRFRELTEAFSIPKERKLSTFSKGMKRQAAIILALASRPKYLLLDEAFDGLDPIMRALLRKLLAKDVAERGCTVIISSHNLRELEDLCDQLGVVHRGRILFERDIDELKLGFCKVQAAFDKPLTDSELSGLDIVQQSSTGSLINLIARGKRDDVIAYLNRFKPLFLESVPLTLEEVFIHEMEAVGYDYKNIIV